MEFGCKKFTTISTRVNLAGWTEEFCTNCLSVDPCIILESICTIQFITIVSFGTVDSYIKNISIALLRFHTANGIPGRSAESRSDSTTFRKAKSFCRFLCLSNGQVACNNPCSCFWSEWAGGDPICYEAQQSKWESLMFHAPHQYSRHAFPGKMDIDLQKTHKKTSSEFGAKFPVETASFDKFFRDFIGPGICCCYCRMALQGRKNIYSKRWIS